ncbi:MAG: anhydro-N-acetylmuramic acid kinase [Rubrivivax sp.]|nr:anhydro-N-acetylmuramic acid kinase [Rubrivivax sp.]
MAWFIGLMSGTSLDGVDGVLAEAIADSGPLQVQGHAHRPFPEALRSELLALNRSASDEIHRGALAANALMAIYAEVVALLLKQAGLSRGQISAIGAHGQTVRHRPGQFDGLGYTVQLMNGALLAERTGMAVVCDFRSRDVAAGGQGAPLVPAFHASRFGQAGRDTAVLNLGGIANLTLLRASGEVLGFDCGPGNLLLDLWCRRHRGQPYDAGGTWAAGGRVDAGLLGRLLAEPFFGLAPPKSTGRDLFDEAWLAARLGSGPLDARDVMATLAELTARGAADALRQHAPATARLLVCGGGAFNAHLLARLADLLGSAVAVESTAVAGVPPDQVEALAFAWLAKAFMERRAGNLPAVTGAAGPRVLGALYPAT